jgi:uncharacterized protein (TIGR01777 family)
MTDRRVVLAGGSGFLGTVLAKDLVTAGYQVVNLTRTPRSDTMDGKDLPWDGRTVGAWSKALDGAAAVVNLTGRSVDCRYTATNRREIIASRLDSVRAIGMAINQCAAPPRAWVQASSLAIYGDAGDRICDETAPHGQGFSVEVCERWEAAVEQQTTPYTRKTILRIGFALGRGGGALGKLARLARLGLGGTVGSGRQYISWLHIADLNRMFRWGIEHEQIVGTYNATGPHPVPNATFMRELRRVLRVPLGLPAPAFMVRMGAFVMRTEVSLALTGRRCVPARFTEQGFAFTYTDLGETLRDLLG